MNKVHEGELMWLGRHDKERGLRNGKKYWAKVTLLESGRVRVRIFSDNPSIKYITFQDLDDYKAKFKEVL